MQAGYVGEDHHLSREDSTVSSIMDGAASPGRAR